MLNSMWELKLSVSKASMEFSAYKEKFTDGCYVSSNRYILLDSVNDLPFSRSRSKGGQRRIVLHKQINVLEKASGR